MRLEGREGRPCLPLSSHGKKGGGGVAMMGESGGGVAVMGEGGGGVAVMWVWPMELAGWALPPSLPSP